MPSGRGKDRGLALAFCGRAEGLAKAILARAPIPLTAAARTHRAPPPRRNRPHAARSRVALGRARTPTPLTAAPRTHRAPPRRRNRPHAVRGRAAGGGARAPTPLTAAPRTHQALAPRRNRAHAFRGRLSDRCCPPPHPTRIDHTRLAGAGDAAARYTLTHCSSRRALDALTPPRFHCSAFAHLLRDQLVARALRCCICA